MPSSDPVIKAIVPITFAYFTASEGVSTTKAVASTQSNFDLGYLVHSSFSDTFGISRVSFGSSVKEGSYFLSFLSTDQGDLLVLPPSPVVYVKTCSTTGT